VIHNHFISTFILTFFLGCQVQAQLSDADTPIIPNVITPNNDGRNDSFEIRKSPDSLFSATEAPSLIVFNRWGKSIYESSTYLNQWDAYGLESGQYFYIVQLKSGRRFNGVLSIVQ